MGGIFTRMKKIYYKKGYIIEYINGKKRLVKALQRVSYEQKILETDVQEEEINGVAKKMLVATKTDLIPFQTDYITYTSHETKYGLVPVNSILDIYEVKYLIRDGFYHIYDTRGKEIMIL